MTEKRMVYCSMPKYADITIDEGNECLTKHGFDTTRPISYYDDPISNMRIFSQEVEIKEKPKVEHGFVLKIGSRGDFLVSCKCTPGNHVVVNAKPNLDEFIAALSKGWGDYLVLNGSEHA